MTQNSLILPSFFLGMLSLASQSNLHVSTPSGYGTRSLENLFDDSNIVSRGENNSEPFQNQWLENKYVKVDKKLNHLSLLAAIGKVLKEECQPSPSHSSSFNLHKPAFDEIFSIDIQLIKLTAGLISDFVTNQNPIKFATNSTNQEPKSKPSKKGTKKKSSKKSKHMKDFLPKRANETITSKASVDFALAATLRGLMKNLRFIHSTWLVLADGDYHFEAGYERKKKVEGDLVQLRHFEKDTHKLVASLSKHLHYDSSEHCHKGQIMGVSDGVWTEPFKACSHPSQWFVTLYTLFRKCSETNAESYSGLMEVVVNLKLVDVDQCSTDSNEAWANTHKCPLHSSCKRVKGHGLRDGGYRCECLSSFTPLKKEGDLKETECVRCERDDCRDCSDGTCQDTDTSHSIVIILFVLHASVMLAVLVPGVVVVRMRRVKIMQFSFWQLYEVMIVGAVLIYTSVLLELQNTHALACSLVPWCRELGFALLYASLMLKIHKISVESKSRQAQRTLMRDKDLARYLAIVLALLVWQLVAWTLMNVEKVVAGLDVTLGEVFCRMGYWSLTLQIIEFILLAWAFFLFFHINFPPSFHVESRAIIFIIANEALVSAAFNIARYLLESSLTTNTSFITSFCRCHLTVTVNLAVILGTKFWQAKCATTVLTMRSRKPESKPVVHDNLKKQLSNVSKKSHESNDMTVDGLNPEEVKAEFMRLHKQLEMFKGKIAKKEVNQAGKKQPTSKKQGPRRFSLHNFHQARHRHHTSVGDKTSDEPQNSQDVLKGTPDESLISSDIISAGPSAI